MIGTILTSSTVSISTPKKTIFCAVHIQLRELEQTTYLSFEYHIEQNHSQCQKQIRGIQNGRQSHITGNCLSPAVLAVRAIQILCYTIDRSADDLQR